MFNLEYFLPDYIKIQRKKKIKTFSAIQGLKTFTGHAPFLIKLLEDVLQENKVANPKRLSYLGNRNDPRE